MPGLILPGPFHKILVVGALYNNIDKLTRLSEIASEYDWIIFNSGLCHPMNDVRQVKERILLMKEFIGKHRSAYIVGRTDYLMLTKTSDLEIESWVKGSYNVAFIDFSSRAVVVLDGGIHNGIQKRSDLYEDMEVSFTSRIDDKSWHDSYNGRVGFVISNNPLVGKSPQIYSHSMQLGNAFVEDGPVYAIEVDDISLKKTIVL